MCMDDGHINERIKESNPQFYYSEEQRAALEQLLKDGDGAFKNRLKEDKVNDFLSAREIKFIRKTFQEYSDCEDDLDSTPAQTAKGDSGIHSTYWPQLSDIVPPLDIGWPDGGFYKGVTRVTVHTNPPREDSPHIKQVVRKLIQESNKVLAVVMDLLTDLQILQDLLDAASKRNVSVYILLDARGMPFFLDICSRLQVSALHLKNMRVRTVRGTGMTLSFGKLPGSLSNKYMLVDGNKVMFGSYSFTWSSSRLDRSTIVIMTGHVVDFFDREFRETYAVSERVDLYGELHVAKAAPAPEPAPEPAPKPAPKPAPVQPMAAPPAPPFASRFHVSLGDPCEVRTKILAHKYYNPKYSLVVGVRAGATNSLTDVPIKRESPGGPESKGLMERFLAASSETLDRLTPVPVPVSPTESEGKEGAHRPNGLAHIGKKHSLRGQDDSSPCSSPTRVSRKPPKLSPARVKRTAPSPPTTCVSVETTLNEEQGDKFGQEASEGSLQTNGKIRTLSRGSKNTSLQAVNTQEGDASKVQKRPQRSGCFLS
ncbi:hypothetical protein SKAU_G00120420 [Synaphobranchus kaupii]|uniref:Scaffolding anchor of CK1 domain-containing protein n=1 Tax=Synaphobranchus kaupii TaxID=118154 RepID=A0A9Q1FNY4_SYNKA|nr:hypothetical protein SKAU_G00120420 [Synaphobranchus kaupii]